MKVVHVYLVELVDTLRDLTQTTKIEKLFIHILKDVIAVLCACESACTSFENDRISSTASNKINRENSSRLQSPITLL